jgi:hypothetical protein
MPQRGRLLTSNNPVSDKETQHSREGCHEEIKPHPFTSLNSIQAIAGSSFFMPKNRISNYMHL